jgi:hypothetical protein
VVLTLGILGVVGEIIERVVRHVGLVVRDVEGAIG